MNKTWENLVEAAMDSDPDVVAELQKFAAAFELQGQPEKALLCFRKALELAERHQFDIDKIVKLEIRLSSCLMELDELEEAQSRLEHADQTANSNSLHPFTEVQLRDAQRELRIVQGQDVSEATAHLKQALTKMASSAATSNQENSDENNDLTSKPVREFTEVTLPSPPGPIQASEVLELVPIAFSGGQLRFAAVPGCLMLLWESDASDASLMLDMEGEADQSIAPLLLGNPECEIADWPGPADVVLTARELGERLVLPRAWFDWGASQIAVGPYSEDVELLQQTINRLQTSAMSLAEKVEGKSDFQTGEQLQPREYAMRVQMGPNSVGKQPLGNASRVHVRVKVYDVWHGQPTEEEYLAKGKALCISHGNLHAELQFESLPTEKTYDAWFLLGGRVVGVARVINGKAVLYERPPGNDGTDRPLPGWEVRLVPTSFSEEAPNVRHRFQSPVLMQSMKPDHELHRHVESQTQSFTISQSQTISQHIPERSELWQSIPMSGARFFVMESPFKTAARFGEQVELREQRFSQ